MKHLNQKVDLHHFPPGALAHNVGGGPPVVADTPERREAEIGRRFKGSSVSFIRRLIQTPCPNHSYSQLYV